MDSRLLYSNRLFLRAIELGRDRDLLYLWENDARSWASSGAFNPISTQFIDQYIIQSTSSILEQSGLNLMMIDTDSDVPVGYVQLQDFEPISKRIGIGLYVAPECRRRGYACEALELVHDYVRRRLGCRMAYASILENNQACLRLFQSLGYLHVGTLEGWQWYDGHYYDLKYYQLWL
ncbi:MAG: GNAT family N-acetyltransferase [Porphyromonadaceae bacterium]|nr:GNAT family N-acetyltransferase [Porphyromonadaceae bacterium]